MDTTTDRKRQLRGIVLDVDGTLLDPADRIAPDTAAAVRRARAAGLEVLLASGRSPRAMRDLLVELELEGPAVAFTGALTFRLAGDDGGLRVLAETLLEPADAAAVHALAAAAGVEIGWFTVDGWRVGALGPGVAEESALTGEPPLVDPALPDGAPAPHKLMCIAVTRERAAALHALRDALPPGVRGLFSHPRYLEITAAGVDKAPAVRAATAALGLAPGELAAVGDEENDLGMLRDAGLAIAMGNAAPAVIAAADRVTATNAAGGVALAIDALLDGRWRIRRAGPANRA